MTANNIDDFRGFSMAMYSTWLWHQPSRVMFDAGEGIASYMRNHVFAIENVFLSHGHHDHLGGLAGLAMARASARGDKDKSFSVYYPGGWGNINALKTYIQSVSKNMNYELNWREIYPGESIPVSDHGKVLVRAFQVRHARELCLGYSMVESRTRLKKEFVGLDGKEIAAIAAQHDRSFINETYEKVLFAYSGDCSGFASIDSVRNADILFHEATFVDDKDMDIGGGHSTVAQAINIAAEANVGTLVLVHVSTRFEASQVIDMARQMAGKIGYAGHVHLLYGNRKTFVK